MTAIAFDRLDRDHRAPLPREAPGPSSSRRTFASLVEDVERPPAKPPNDDSEARARDGSGVPSEISAEVSLVMKRPVVAGAEVAAVTSAVPVISPIPSIIPAIPSLSITPSLDPDERSLELQPQGTGVLPLPIEGETSDGVPVAIEAGPRPRPRKTADDDLTMATPIPLGVRELMHARTELALPIVTGSGEGSHRPGSILEAIPMLPELAAAPPGAAIASAGAVVAQAPLTPLEQAVHDLLANLDKPDEGDEPTLDAPFGLLPEVKLLSIEYPDAPAPVAPIAEPELPTTQANPSHVHLVIDDGAERVVVTVAVRGSEVNVALRGQDDATTAALARNAGSLDHMMRARGLDLASLMTQRDPDSRRPDREHRERDRKPDEKFSLEELA